MRKAISRLRELIHKHRKYAPIAFFIGGFIWDSLTLGRIDRLYDRVILCTYLASLTLCLYLYNLVDDGKWKKTFLARYEEYLPLAIQFFLGGLASAYVIYFSRSVSFSKTASFFVILVILLFANELLKKRISNKYMQFSAYFFVSFTFFAFFIPVVLKQMNYLVFLLSGIVSLSTSSALILYIYHTSPSTRAEIHRGRMLGLIFGIYLLINGFYYFNLIPPVPLALQTGLVAHHVKQESGDYIVTYEKHHWYEFWKDHRSEFLHRPGQNVYVFSSIFAPSELKKGVSHRWKWLNPQTKEWQIADNIGFEIMGGRDDGYRGYTYKSNVMEGRWNVDVITEEGQVLGIIDFEIRSDSNASPVRLVDHTF